MNNRQKEIKEQKILSRYFFFFLTITSVLIILVAIITAAVKNRTEIKKNDNSENIRQSNTESQTIVPISEQVPTDSMKKEKNTIFPKLNWFSLTRWLTDEEIDWTLERIISELSGEEKSKYKVLESTQFTFAKEIVANDDPSFEARVSFPQLLLDLVSFSGELVFIPVHNPDTNHWSLLVFKGENKKFWHWDTSRNGLNKEYVKPVVEELLKHLLNTNTPSLEENLIFKSDIAQGNNHDCGVAVVALAERIMKEGLDTNLSDLNKNFGPEREKWQGKIKVILGISKNPE